MAKEIRRIRDAVESQLRKTDKIIASAEAIEERISELNDTIGSGLLGFALN